MTHMTRQQHGNGTAYMHGKRNGSSMAGAATIGR